MKEILQQFDVWSAVDILFIAFIIYHVLLLIRGTRAAQMLTGILIIVAAFLLSSVIPLTTLNWVMNKFYSSFIIILVIIFQDDIRHVLSRIGKKSFIAGNDQTSSNWVLDEITRAAISLAGENIGALIVVERNIKLKRYVDIGVLLDAKITKEIIVSIFQPSTPLHDGAIILQGGRIAAAACFLPLTRNEDLDPNLGTRHRAAVGISQETDAVVVVVSEEGGYMSLAVDGEIYSNLSRKVLRSHLQQLLLVPSELTATENDSTPSLFSMQKWRSIKPKSRASDVTKA